MNEREYIPDDVAASVGLKAVRVKPERLPTRRERYLELRGRGFPALLAWRVSAYGPLAAATGTYDEYQATLTKAVESMKLMARTLIESERLRPTIAMFPPVTIRRGKR